MSDGADGFGEAGAAGRTAWGRGFAIAVAGDSTTEVDAAGAAGRAAGGFSGVFVSTALIRASWPVDGGWTS